MPRLDVYTPVNGTKIHSMVLAEKNGQLMPGMKVSTTMARKKELAVIIMQMDLNTVDNSKMTYLRAKERFNGPIQISTLANGAKA